MLVDMLGFFVFFVGCGWQDASPRVDPSDLLEIVEKLTWLEIKVFNFLFWKISMFYSLLLQQVIFATKTKLVAHKFEKFENL